MQPRVQVIMDSFADWAHFENVEKESILTKYINFCRKGEIGRVVRRRDQFNRGDDMRREKNRANVQNTDNTRDGMERQSVEEPSNSVSTAEVLQFYLGCFRCNFCQVTLKEKDGKRSCLKNLRWFNISMLPFITSPSFAKNETDSLSILGRYVWLVCLEHRPLSKSLLVQAAAGDCCRNQLGQQLEDQNLQIYWMSKRWGGRSEEAQERRKEDLQECEAGGTAEDLLRRESFAISLHLPKDCRSDWSYG